MRWGSRLGLTALLGAELIWALTLPFAWLAHLPDWAYLAWLVSGFTIFPACIVALVMRNTRRVVRDST
jgi:hypothetical protein